MATLWIDRSDPDADGRVSLRLEGHLTGDGITLLRQECHELLETSHTVVIDLSGLTYVSPAGLGILAAFEAGGIELRNGSPLVRDLLHDLRVR